MNEIRLAKLAEMADVSRQKIYLMVKRGVIRTKWVMGLKCVTKREAEKFIAAVKKARSRSKYIRL